MLSGARSFTAPLCARVALAGALAIAAVPAYAQTPPAAATELEALLQVEVTSASRRQQKLADAAAAVFVLTRDEIRRSGLTSVPELLRLVPGVQVARIDGNKWAISVRGFNSRWANKLLVMIDGRSVYNPVFAGVFWDALDVPVEHIERIEVVRGPGGSLWGANAVNGIINIITRTSARREAAVTAGGGSRGNGFGGVRYAAPLGSRLEYFAHADGMDRKSTSEGTHDQWRQFRYGAGLAAELSSRDKLYLDGGGLTNTTSALGTVVLAAVPFKSVQQPIATETDSRHVSLRWTRALRKGAGLDSSVAFSHADRVGHDDRTEVLAGHTSDALEASFQHSVAPLGCHEIIWGAALRRISNDVRGSLQFEVQPASATDAVVGVFAQDEMPFFAERLTVVFGAKVERASHTGWQLQPTARVRWNPATRHTIWGAVSRAVRTPSLAQRGMLMPVFGLATGSLPIVGRIEGNPDVRSETLNAYEAGYRWTTAGIAVDVAAFYNSYDTLSTLEPRTPHFEPSPVPHLRLPLEFDNMAAATTLGGEVLASITPKPWWRLTGSYALFAIDSTLDAASRDRRPLLDGAAPRHQGVVRSLVTLSNRVEVDASVSLVGALESLDVPAYARADVRVGWRPVSWLQLSFSGQNLSDEAHIEFRETGDGPTVQSAAARRRFWTTATWRF